MSDGDMNEVYRGEDVPEAVSSATIDELLEFLKERKAFPRCWLCGSTSVYPLAHQTLTVDKGPIGSDFKRPAIVFKSVQVDEQINVQAQVPAFVLSCSNCGFTFDLVTPPFDEWKKERDKKDG